MKTKTNRTQPDAAFKKTQKGVAMTAADLRARAARLCDADVRAAWRDAVDAGRAHVLELEGQTTEAALDYAFAPIFAAFTCGPVRLVVAGLNGGLIIAWDGADGRRFVDFAAAIGGAA